MTESTTGLYCSIHAQPQAVRELLIDWNGPKLAAEKMAGAKRVLLLGTGTSFHAASVGEYLLRMVGIDAWAMRLIDFVSYPRPLQASDAVVVISHRGSKLYGMKAIEHCRQAKVTTIGITGKASKIEGVDQLIETVAQDPSSTHSISYTGTLTRLAQLAVQLGLHNGQSQQAQRIEQGLSQLPALMEQILSREEEIRQIAQEAIAQQRRIYFIGAGPNAVTAPEGALKAKEAAYVTAEGFELEQAIHGPMVAFEQNDLLIPIGVRGATQERVADLLLALSEINPRLWLIGEAPGVQSTGLFSREGWSLFPLLDESIQLPEELTPLLAVLPVQLLAEFLAAARGTNADSFRKEQEPYQRAGTRFRL